MRRLSVHCILPSSPWLADSKTNIPLGVLYIAAMLREKGHDVFVTSRLNFRANDPYNWSDRALAADVHMVGFCSPQFNEVIDMCADLRRKAPGSLIIGGGPHPSYEPDECTTARDQFREHPNVILKQRRDYSQGDGAKVFDTVVVMEGEPVIFDLLEDWENGCLKPQYFGDKKALPNLDVVPFPAWDLLPEDHIHNDGKAVMKHQYFPNAKYPDASTGVMSIIGTRGCFPAGTPVLLASGIEMPIELLQEGDFLKTFNPATGALGANKLLQKRARIAEDLFEIKFGSGRSIQVTGEHPFVTKRGWQTVEELKVGDSLRLQEMFEEVSEAVHQTSFNMVPNTLEAGSRKTTCSEKQATNKAARQVPSLQATNSLHTMREHEDVWQSSLRNGKFGSEQTRLAKPSVSKRGSGENKPYSEDTVRENYFEANEKEMGRWANAKACLYRKYKQAGEAIWQSPFETQVANTSRRIRRFLDRSMCLWQETLSGLHTQELAFETGSSFQRTILAHEGRDAEAVGGLHLKRMECLEHLGRSTSTPTSSTNVALGERISGRWIRITEITFLGKSVVYPLSVENDETFFAHGLAVHNCPYKCTYCSTPWIGQQPRYRSSHNIIAEMAQTMDMGVRMFKFQDDTYTLHKTKLRGLAEDVRSAFGADSFACRIHTRVNTMTPHVAESLHMMNCKVTCFGIESGSQKVLDANQKGTTVKQNFEALKMAKEEGFYTIAFLVSGLAGETEETAKETMEWLDSVKPYLDSCNLAVGIPYPGARFWTHPTESGIEILDYNYDHQWIVGFSARNEILVRPHGTTYDKMMKIKSDTFDYLRREGWAKAEWDEDSRIQTKQDAEAPLIATAGMSPAM